MAKKMMGCCSLWVSGLVLFVMILSPANAAVQCGDAVSKLIPCEAFLIGASIPVPSDECCAGAQALDKVAAASQPDRKALCECLKQAATSFPINYDRANLLPKLCKLSINIPISLDVDCNKV